MTSGGGTRVGIGVLGGGNETTREKRKVWTNVKKAELETRGRGVNGGKKNERGEEEEAKE